MITKVDFEPESASDEAGLWIINGPETHYAKVFSTVNTDGKNLLKFSFSGTSYEVENIIILNLEPESITTFVSD